MAEKRYYTYEDDKLILENWWDRHRQHIVTDRINDRSRNSIALRFYRLITNMGMTPGEYRAKMVDSQSSEVKDFQMDEHNKIQEIFNEPNKVIVYDESVDRKIEELESKMKTIQEENKEGKEGFINWLENILYLYKFSDSAISMSKLTNDNFALRNQIEELELKVKSLEDKLRKEKMSHEKIFNELDFWLGQFFKLSSVEKIASLQDFLPKIKTVVDTYGTVLGIDKTTPVLIAASSETVQQKA
jgi:predicted RNase H-like nuclease (RuvC/YqgF family)